MRLPILTDKTRLALELVKAARAAVDVKALTLEKAVRRRASHVVHQKITLDTEKRVQAALQPVIREQVESIVRKLRRQSLEKVFEPETKGFDAAVPVVFDSDPVKTPINLPDGETRPEPPNMMRLPLVRQKNGWYCGPASLCSIVNYLNNDNLSQEEVAGRCRTTERDGTNPRDLANAASYYGLVVTTIQCMTVDQIVRAVDLGMPMLVDLQAWGDPKDYGRDDNGHWVAACGYDDENIYFMDPSTDGDYGYINREELLTRWHDEETGGEKTERLGIVCGLLSRRKGGPGSGSWSGPGQPRFAADTGGGTGGGSSGQVLIDGKLPRESTERIAKRIADVLSFPPEKIHVEDITNEIDVGGMKFIEGGHYHDDQDEIHIRAEGWASSDHVVRITTHEVQHHRWKTVMDAYEKESKAVIADARNVMRASGEIREEYKKEFPVYSLLQKIWGPILSSNKLEEEDGVTPYSKAYWDKYSEVKGQNFSSDHFKLAINETLAEMAAEKGQTGIVPGGKLFRNLYKAIDKSYAIARKSGYRWKSAQAVPIADFHLEMYFDELFNPCEPADSYFVMIHTRNSYTVGVRNQERKNVSDSESSEREDGGRPPGGDQHGADRKSALLEPGGVLAEPSDEAPGGDVLEGGGRGAGPRPDGCRPSDVPGDRPGDVAGVGEPGRRNPAGAVRGGSGRGGGRGEYLRSLDRAGSGRRGLHDVQAAVCDPGADGGARRLSPGGAGQGIGDGRGELGAELELKQHASGKLLRRVFDPSDWREKLTDAVLPPLAVGMAKSMVAQLMVLGVDVRRKKSRRGKKSISSLYTKTTRASEWLDEDPDNLDLFEEMLQDAAEIGIPDVGIVTELPATMKTRIADNLQDSFRRDYWDGISETTGGNAETILKQGLQDGWSVREMAEKIQDSMGEDYVRGRAFNIARTECLPGDTVVDGANVLAVHRRLYSGEFVEVITKGGRKFSGTPNHPMLTTRGWVAIGDLTEADNLICHKVGVQFSTAPDDEHVQNPPTTLSNIFDSLSAIGVGERRRTAKPDFHGDGMDGYVDIFASDGELFYGIEPPIDKSIVDFILSESGVGKGLLPSGGRINKHSIEDKCLGIPVCSDLLTVSSKKSSDRSGIYSDGCCDVTGGFTGLISVDDVRSDVGEFCMGTVSSAQKQLPCILESSGLNAGIPAIPGNRPRMASHDLCDLISAQATLVEFDHLLTIRRFQWSGHVFNLTTREGYYIIANGVCTGNSGGALNGARKEAMDDVVDALPEEYQEAMRPTWLSVLGPTTRDTHADLDGVPADDDGMWELGGVKIPWPGHPDLPASERCNCMCSLVMELGMRPARAQHLIDDYYDRMEEGEKALRAIRTKGDAPGHEFHGNQWTGGSGEETGKGHIWAQEWAEEGKDRASEWNPREAYDNGLLDSPTGELIVHHGNKSGYTSDEGYLFVTLSESGASFHGELFSYRVKPGAKIYPDLETDRHNSMTGMETLFSYGGSSAIIHISDLEPVKKSDKTKGGPGSGNFGHSGRPGQVGGSSTSGGSDELLGARLDSIFGHTVTAVIRRLGKEGFNAREVRRVMDHYGVVVNHNTIRGEIGNGRAGRRGEPAPLTAEQMTEIRNVVAGKKPIEPTPLPPPTPIPPTPLPPKKPEVLKVPEPTPEITRSKQPHEMTADELHAHIIGLVKEDKVRLKSNRAERKPLEDEINALDKRRKELNVPVDPQAAEDARMAWGLHWKPHGQRPDGWEAESDRLHKVYVEASKPRPENVDELNRVCGELNRKNVELNKITERQRSETGAKKALDAVKLPQDKQAKLQFTTSGYEGSVATLSNQVDRFNEVVDKDMLPRAKVNFQTRKDSNRSCYSGYGVVKMSPGAGASIVVHELGHWIEDHRRDVRSELTQYRRGATDGATLKKLGRGYDDSEVYKERTDGKKWIDKYMGKIYSSGDTEMLSMGLQMYTTDPIKLAKGDPVLFKIIAKTVRGK